MEVYVRNRYEILIEQTFGVEQIHGVNPSFDVGTYTVSEGVIG